MIQIRTNAIKDIITNLQGYERTGFYSLKVFLCLLFWGLDTLGNNSNAQPSQGAMVKSGYMPVGAQPL